MNIYIMSSWTNCDFYHIIHIEYGNKIKRFTSKNVTNQKIEVFYE